MIVDMEAGKALARGLARRSGEDRFEEMGQAFQARLREGFLKTGRRKPGPLCCGGRRPARRRGGSGCAGPYPGADRLGMAEPEPASPPPISVTARPTPRATRHLFGQARPRPAFLAAEAAGRVHFPAGC